MFASTYTPGWGYSRGHGFAAAAPSALDLIEQARARAYMLHAQGLGYFAGFGQPANDFNTFNNGSSSPASFVGGTGALNIVFCNKDSAFRPQCVLNKTGDGNKAPIRDMQRAIDRVMDQIPTNSLAGRELRGQMPTGDGTTSEQTFTVPSNLLSPIATGGGGGIDGIVGDTTTKFGVLALTLAGMLKAFPNPGISAAFVSPTRNDVWAEFSTEIANYLNDVANNFPELLQAFEARGNVPIQTQLDVSTIPFVVPLAAQSNKTGLIIGTAAAMLGLTALAAVSAARHKPAMAYEDAYKPALGRGRRGRKSRGW